MSAKGPPSIVCYILQENGILKKTARQFVPTFGFFGYCRREYLTLENPFAIFRALDMAPACLLWNSLSRKLFSSLPVFFCFAKMNFAAKLYASSVNEKLKLSNFFGVVIIFRPYFIWERKIFKSNGFFFFFFTKFAKILFIFKFKGVTHRIQPT